MTPNSTEFSGQFGPSLRLTRWPLGRNPNLRQLGADIAQVSAVGAMGIPDPVRETYLINDAHTRASGLIEAFSTHQPTESAAIVARVGAVLDEYCDSLLDDLQHAVGTVDVSEAEWLRKHYLSLIVEFATSLRDSIADRTSRHAAAQVIQCKVLEHERNLRIVVDPHADMASTDATVSDAVKVIPK